MKAARLRTAIRQSNGIARSVGRDTRSKVESVSQDRSPLSVLTVTGIFPPDIGGPATYVPVMARELTARGHRMTVITLSGSLDHDDRSYSFRLKRIRRGLFKPWRFLLTVAAIIGEGRHADVLYVNGLFLEAVIANYFLRKRLVQKIVGDWAWERATNKGWVKANFEDFQKRKHSLNVELLKSLRRFCARRADAVIVPSQYLAHAVAGWGVAESKVKVVYNAVELPSWSLLPVPLSTPIKMVTVGRLVPWKRIDQIMEALVECQQAGLVIVGDGPERGRLEAIARNCHLSDRVYFAGQRSKEETFGLMAACDLFVLNSTYEGFPHVLLEAMSVGLPVVATAVGGTAELVRDGENGTLIAPNSSQVVAKRLQQILSSPEERQRLATGAQRTLQGFQSFRMIEQTVGVLSRTEGLDEEAQP